MNQLLELLKDALARRAHYDGAVVVAPMGKRVVRSVTLAGHALTSSFS